MNAELEPIVKLHSNQTSVNPSTRRTDITDIFGRMYANGKKANGYFHLDGVYRQTGRNSELKFDRQLPHVKFSHPTMFRSNLT